VHGDTDPLAVYARWVLAPDLPTPPREATSSYFICGAPRGGTWLLAGLLHGTGVAGHPHEYFWQDTEAANRARWGASNLLEYLARVKEAGTTANGVFAAKLMWGYLRDVLDELRDLAGETAVADRALIELFFPSPRFVFVWRRN
jgi:trehalose 2-sulfotransferase